MRPCFVGCLALYRPSSPQRSGRSIRAILRPCSNAIASPPRTRCRSQDGAVRPAPVVCEWALPSGRYCCGYLVKRRIGNFVSMNLGCTIDELVQVLHDFWVAGPGVGLGVLLVIPQANRDRVRPARSEEREFALKACLLSKGRNGFRIDQLGERHRAVGFQMNGQIT